jgi:hypothetical protein
MINSALPQAGKMANLRFTYMTEKYPIQSEGEQLESFLGDLEKEHTVKNISGWETGFANLSRALDGILPGLYFLSARRHAARPHWPNNFSIK